MGCCLDKKDVKYKIISNVSLNLQQELVKFTSEHLDYIEMNWKVS